MPVKVSLVHLDGALRTSRTQCGLIEALENLGGQLRNLRTEKADARIERERRWAGIAEHPLALEDQSVLAWHDELRRIGLARRLAGAAETDVVRVAMDALGLARRQEGLRLGVLAARITGNAHALDRGHPAGSLAVHFITWTNAMPYPEDAAEWRRAWAEAGVACDDLSCDVLVFRAPGWAVEPLRLTLRQVTKWVPGPGKGPVFVCENPAVVSAAADLPDSAPIVCVEGIPSTAAVVALEKLAASGRSIHYHGDFDWRGISIAAVIFRRVAGSQPWRFKQSDYQSALEAGLGTTALRGKVHATPWDQDLSKSMAAAGVAIYEEQVLDPLLEDLNRQLR